MITRNGLKNVLNKNLKDEYNKVRRPAIKGKS